MRYIEPEQIIKNRFKDKQVPHFDGAIMLFRDRYTSSLIKYNLKCKGLEQKILYGTYENNVHFVKINNHNILVIEQLIWGGPQAAIIIEELACFGVKKIIGLGACGSLTERFKKGDIIIDKKAYITDGTSKYYSDQKYIELNTEIYMNIDDRGYTFACSGTIDALYQETYENITRFVKIGAEIINMESATLYAVSEKMNIKSVWVGCVSDVLVKNCWDNWFDTKEATVESALVVNDIAERIFC